MNKCKWKKWFVGLFSGVFLLSNCGMQTVKKEENENAHNTMGRYVETSIPCEQPIFYPLNIYKTEEGIRITERKFNDMLLKDEEERTSVIPKMNFEGEFRSIALKNKNIYSMATAPSGARMFSIVELISLEEREAELYHYLLTADDKLIEWKELSDKEDRAFYWYGKDGYFYVYARKGEENNIYRVDSTNGDTEFLLEAPDNLRRLFACGDYLFVATNDNLYIYSIQRKELLTEDKVLLEAVKPYFDCNNGDWSISSGFLIEPAENDENIYVLTRDGLYHHTMYGNVMEQMIDGSLNSISDVETLFTDMYVDNTISGEGNMPVFYLLYADGSLAKFEFDKNISSIPESLLRVYSLYEDTNVRQVITAFRGKYPEVYVQYEVGVTGEGGQTREDALKNLATAVAAGEGPDVLVMDGIPYDSYVEKGVLLDLKDLYGEMQEEDPVWKQIANDLYEEDMLFVLPMAFKIPVIMGDAKELQDISTLEDLADKLEQMPQKPECAKIGFVTPKRTLEILGEGNCEKWLNKNGNINKDELQYFLTQCKRIYEADIKDLSEEQAEYIEQATAAIRLQSLVLPEGDAALMALGAYTFDFEYAAGNLGGDIEFESNIMNSFLKEKEKCYQFLPGADKICIPITMLAINKNAKIKEEAKEFMRFALSGDFQAKTVLNGTPINVHACYAKQLNTQSVVYSVYLDNTAIISEEQILHISWADKEELADYLEFIKSVDKVSLCDEYVWNTVMELGEMAVSGEKTIEEAVDEIEGRLQLYLAE